MKTFTNYKETNKSIKIVKVKNEYFLTKLDNIIYTSDCPSGISEVSFSTPEEAKKWYFDRFDDFLYVSCYVFTGDTETIEIFEGK